MNKSNDQDLRQHQAQVPQKAQQPQQQQPQHQQPQQKQPSQSQPQGPAPQQGTQKTPQQQPQGLPTMDEIKGTWKQQVGEAKIAWGKLTEDELLKTEGQVQKLTGMVQERYAITREEAHKQVKSFFEKCKSAMN